MLPVVKGVKRTKWEMLAYTVILVPVSLLPTVMGFAGLFYAAAAAVLGLGFLACAVWSER